MVSQRQETADGVGNIKVVVRVRPPNARELARGAKGLVKMEGDKTYLESPDVGGAMDKKERERRSHAFTFDKSYWSATDLSDAGFASQHTIYEDLGVELLEHSFQGFNTCIIAYGQTGSGKSYTVMGYGEEKGLIPLTTEQLFRTIEERKRTEPDLKLQVEASYLEIYNEKVRDLLNLNNKVNLKVRESPAVGPYVEGLEKLVVQTYEEMMVLLEEGTKTRTVASTNMNTTSSRSHAIFQLTLTQRRFDPVTKLEGEKVSNISLVDLAGSERANSSGATGKRLKEGAQINKSLTTLGKVIQVLASASSDHGKKGRKSNEHVPFRDSTLTWLLKESLGGNSKTAMVATISPTDYDETLSTLRYADQAKRIKTKAVVNEDPNQRMIRELKAELEMLRSKTTSSDESAFDANVPPEKQMVTYQTKDGELKTVSKLELQESLEASEKLMTSLNQTWEEKMARSAQVHLQREKALEELGITVDKSMVGIHPPKRFPHLVNLSEDPWMSECLVYQIQSGTTVVGNTSSSTATIKLSGFGLLDEHCFFENKGGQVFLTSQEEGTTLVNGHPLGSAPEAVKKRREQSMLVDEKRSSTPDPPTVIDWDYARREAALAGQNMKGADLDRLDDEVLDELFNDILKARSKRRPDSRFSHSPSNDETMDDLPDSTQKESVVEAASSELLTPSNDRQDQDFIVVGTPTRSQRKSGSRRSASQYDFLTDDVDDRNAVLEAQAKVLDGEIKRLRHQAAQASISRRSDIQEPLVLTVRERSLARKMIDKWRGTKTFAMSETILLYAKDLREANIIARTNQQSVSYNFIILDEGPADPFLAHSEGPEVGVRVVDGTSIYTWTLGEFRRRLKAMRNLSSDREHFDRDVFRQKPAQPFSCVGVALFALSPCLREQPIEMTVSIFDPLTGEASGTCRISLRLTVVLEDEPSQLVFSLDHITGFTQNDFRRLSAQLALSSLLGPVENDEVLAATIVDLETSSSAHLNLKRSLKLLMTPEREHHLLTELAEIRFFAEPTSDYVTRLERTDARKSVPLQSGPIIKAKNTLRHALLVHLQIQEIDAKGDWKPLEVHTSGSARPTFHIHQGLQRRIVVELQHNSVESLRIDNLTCVSISNIRIGSVIESTQLVELQALSRDVSAGNARIVCLWDSAAHDAPRLNRISDEDISLRLSFLVDFEQSSDPAVLETDFNVRVLSRDAGRSSTFFGFLRSTTISDRQSGIFTLAFEPTRTREPSKLWEMDTSEEKLTNESILGTWRPRSVELVNEYNRLRADQIKHAHLQAVKAILKLARLPPTKTELETTSVQAADSVLRRTVEQWRSFVHTHKPTEIKKETHQEVEAREAIRKLFPQPRSARAPTVKLVKPLHRIAKEGALSLYEPGTNEWHEVWVTLNRPFLKISPKSNKTTLSDLAWLEGADIQRGDIDMESLLQKTNLIIIYARTHTVVLRALKKMDADEWVTTLRIQ